MQCIGTGIYRGFGIQVTDRGCNDKRKIPTDVPSFRLLWPDYRYSSQHSSMVLFNFILLLHFTNVT